MINCFVLVAIWVGSYKGGTIQIPNFIEEKQCIEQGEKLIKDSDYFVRYNCIKVNQPN